LKIKKETIEYLRTTENPYKIKVGEVVVNIEYIETHKKLNECILNILKQKSKID